MPGPAHTVPGHSVVLEEGVAGLVDNIADVSSPQHPTLPPFRSSEVFGPLFYILVFCPAASSSVRMRCHFVSVNRPRGPRQRDLTDGLLKVTMSSNHDMSTLRSRSRLSR